MIDACDPDADIETLRKLIKLNTGQTIRLTKDEICQVYNDILGGNLPLPPLIMSSDRTYMIDKMSPLDSRDYEILFKSSTTRVELKRLARKVGIKQIEGKTKSQLLDAIDSRL